MTVRVFKGEIVQHARLYAGDAFACYIHPIFSELGLNPVSAVITSGSSSAGAAIAVPSQNYKIDSHSYDFTEIEKSLLKTAAGKLLNELTNRFLRQIVYLIHHRRRVTVMYYRRKGPAFANLILKAMKNPDIKIPSAIDGVSLQDALRGLRDVLIMEGNADLKSAIEKHGNWVISLSENITSVDQLLERLENSSERYEAN
jgi:hypothetical protein